MCRTRISLFEQLTNVTNDVTTTSEEYNEHRLSKNRTYKGHILSYLSTLN